MILRKIITSILIGIAISACSDESDCMVADIVQEIENEQLNSKGFYLYLRTSGFSEKEHFYELFKEVPVFDDCGNAAVNAISQVHVDTSIGAPQRITIKNNLIEIEYHSGEVSKPLNDVAIVSD